jgi:hypothetical protein
MAEQLATVDSVCEAYEKAAAVMSKHCLAKNAAKETIEELRKDTTEIGTAIFRTIHDAYAYYWRETHSRANVDAKVRDKEITICPNPGGQGHWDQDWRWHRPFKAAAIEAVMLVASTEGNAEYHADQLCRELLVARDVLLRVENAGGGVIAFKSKTELALRVKEKFTQKWENPLPYHPRYNNTSMETALKDVRNNRVVFFEDKDGRQHKTAFLRKIGRPTDIHWGLRCLGTEMYYIGEKVEQMYSMRELVDRIIGER